MLTDLKLFAFKVSGIVFILLGLITLVIRGMSILAWIGIIIGAFLMFKSNKSRVVLMQG